MGENPKRVSEHRMDENFPEENLLRQENFKSDKMTCDKKVENS